MRQLEEIKQQKIIMMLSAYVIQGEEETYITDA